MIDSFSSAFQECIFEWMYYSLYRSYQERINLVTRLTTITITAIGLSGLLTTSGVLLTTVWTVLIAASQLVSAFKEEFKTHERIYSLKLYLLDKENLVNRMALDWRKIVGGFYAVEEIADLIDKYENEGANLRHKYIDSFHFPDKNHLTLKADVQTSQLLINAHGFKKEEENCNEQERAPKTV